MSTLQQILTKKYDLEDEDILLDDIYVPTNVVVNHLNTLVSEVNNLQKEKQEMREALNQAVKILEEGCLVYDQHVPSGSSSFRVDADMFMRDVSKCYNLSERRKCE